MKTFVINLESRKDRLEAFKENNLKYISYERFEAVNGYDIDYKKLTENEYDTDHNWIDPILETPITRGEIGCFLSHYNLWQRCIESNEPFLILEDDAIIGDKFSYDELYKLIRDEKYNFIYLGWKEMGESTLIDDKYVIPDYPYWLLAYVITPNAARILVNKEIEKNIIPIDEYVPKKLSELNVIAYQENIIRPYNRNEMGSNIHPTERYDYFIDFNIHPVTIATDESKAKRILDSGKTHSIQFQNIGKGVKWNGGTMESTGGGQKINMIKQHIENLPDHDVLFFCDGYDTFVTDTMNEIVYRYLSMNHRIIFSSERSCWPDEELATEIIKHNKTLTPYNDTDSKYLNSGLFVGKVSEIKRLICKSIEDSEDDQLYYQQQYLTGNYDIVLDLESYIFQSYDPDVIVKDKKLYNPKTKCFSCVYHGNGGKEAKRQYELLYDELYGNSPIVYIPTYDYEIIDKDMLLIDFMTPYQCDKMIELSEEYGIFKEADYDKVAGQELRLKQLELLDGLVNHWMKCVYHIVYEYYHPCHIYGVRDAFIIKYAMDSQKSLRLHTDASLVTGSIKLNDDYTGGELVFPRQGVTNRDIDVGKCILFPGQCTHGHTSQELLSGTKYSLTIWTKRWEND